MQGQLNRVSIVPSNHLQCVNVVQIIVVDLVAKRRRLLPKKEEKGFLHNPGNLDRDQYTETGVCLFFDHFGTKVRPVL